ncbi:protease inhibitor I42 family protein [Nocardia caishijiensis]|uniref:Secreted protein n=1 Tax=Nocardia caishijiensis TaxID=184756 RepID=A0ABQ6YLA5_9NOCA|nr:protease inhibitor I42 family protein [Nocardia caishijiensis]KAF0846570.1 putative secreted protein [Nocardia caishijiensis]
MRKSLLVPFVVAALLTGCGDDEPIPDSVGETTLTLPSTAPAAAKPAVTVDQSAAGRTIALDVGQELRVRLPQAVDSDQEWEPVNLDEGILVAEKPVADGGSTVWPLRAVSTGTTTVEFTYGELQEPPARPEGTFLVTVEVS